MRTKSFSIMAAVLMSLLLQTIPVASAARGFAWAWAARAKQEAEARIARRLPRSTAPVCSESLREPERVVQVQIDQKSESTSDNGADGSQQSQGMSSSGSDSPSPNGSNGSSKSGVKRFIPARGTIEKRPKKPVEKSVENDSRFQDRTYLINDVWDKAREAEEVRYEEFCRRQDQKRRERAEEKYLKRLAEQAKRENEKLLLAKTRLDESGPHERHNVMFGASFKDFSGHTLKDFYDNVDEAKRAKVLKQWHKKLQNRYDKHGWKVTPKTHAWRYES